MIRLLGLSARLSRALLGHYIVRLGVYVSGHGAAEEIPRPQVTAPSGRPLSAASVTSITDLVHRRRGAS